MRWVRWLIFLMFAWSLTACAGADDLPEPPAAGLVPTPDLGAAPPLPTLPDVGLPEATPPEISVPELPVPSDGSLPSLPPLPTLPVPLPETLPTLPPLPTLPVETPSDQLTAFATPDWSQVQTLADQIAVQSQTLQTSLQSVLDAASALQAAATTDEMAQLADRMVSLAEQALQDAAQLAVTADDINYRIDQSEDTTLQLSDDIGEMADRIGEMADRILWTEEQIGIMADRIVESEYLINTGTQETLEQLRAALDQVAAETQAIMEHQENMLELLQSSEVAETSDQTESDTADSSSSSSTSDSTSDGTSSSSSTGAVVVAGGAVPVGGMAAGVGTSSQPLTPRRLEVIARCLQLDAMDLQQQDLSAAQAQALTLPQGPDQQGLVERLRRAANDANQIATLASGLYAQARASQTMTPALRGAAIQAYQGLAAYVQDLNQALQQAQVLAERTGDAELMARIETARLRAEHLYQCVRELGLGLSSLR